MLDYRYVTRLRYLPYEVFVIYSVRRYAQTVKSYIAQSDSPASTDRQIDRQTDRQSYFIRPVK